MQKTVQHISGAQYPMLTRTNYAEWVVMMKVMLKARDLFVAVTIDTTDEQEDQMMMEAILKAVPLKLLTLLGSAEDATTKRAWEKIQTMQHGEYRMCKAKAQ